MSMMPFLKMSLAKKNDGKRTTDGWGIEFICLQV